ncbi:30S ribosomal protein S9 [Patescibacteria group bacterium AH-259-L07]|nr:30S ribosomal protein S9 [Patescibacteria group bacterium AH-259-L07]
MWATGKRKSSIARVQFFSSGKGEISINKRSIKDYFPVFELQKSVTSPLVLLKQDKKFTFRIRVHGGGIRGQAEAARLGIARALSELNPEWRKPLKKAGFLKRDPRKKERKKPGLKRARRAPQWAKR